MGWWSDDIMGGDSPLDYLHDLGDLMGAGDLFPLDGWNFKTTAAVKRFLNGPNAVHKIDDLSKEAGDWDGYLVWQVAGVVWLASGVPLGMTASDRMVAALDGDEWMHEDGYDSSRGGKVRAMKDAVLSYRDNPKPVYLNGKGLFESIADHMAGSK